MSSLSEQEPGALLGRLLFMRRTSALVQDTPAVKCASSYTATRAALVAPTADLAARMAFPANAPATSPVGVARRTGHNLLLPNLLWD